MSKELALQIYVWGFLIHWVFNFLRGIVGSIEVTLESIDNPFLAIGFAAAAHLVVSGVVAIFWVVLTPYAIMNKIVS